MAKVNIAEAKARLSEMVELALQGTEVLICRHNRPLARLVSVAPEARRSEPRPVGQAGPFDVPETFFEPLEADVESTFYPPLAPDLSARVAEGPPVSPRK